MALIFQNAITQLSDPTSQDFHINSTSKIQRTSDASIGGEGRSSRGGKGKKKNLHCRAIRVSRGWLKDEGGGCGLEKASKQFMLNSRKGDPTDTCP